MPESIFYRKMINEAQVKKYCSEDISKIENYEQAVNDKTQIWHCHHRLEIQGQFRNSTALLKKCCLYYNVPAWQLIFLTKSEHAKLHMLGRHHSDETRKKLSEIAKHISPETRKKLSIANRGEKNPMFGKHETHPMFGKHHSEETKKKMSMSLSGKFCGEKNPMFGRKWFTNGVDDICQYECPPGFVPGRAKNKKRRSD